MPGLLSLSMASIIARRGSGIAVRILSFDASCILSVSPIVHIMARWCSTLRTVNFTAEQRYIDDELLITSLFCQIYTRLTWTACYAECIERSWISQPCIYSSYCSFSSYCSLRARIMLISSGLRSTQDLLGHVDFKILFIIGGINFLRSSCWSSEY